MNGLFTSGDYFKNKMTPDVTRLTFTLFTLKFRLRLDFHSQIYVRFLLSRFKQFETN